MTAGRGGGPGRAACSCFDSRANRCASIDRALACRKSTWLPLYRCVVTAAIVSAASAAVTGTACGIDQWKERRGGRRTDLSRCWSGRGGDVCEPVEQPVEGDLAVVDGISFVVGKGDAGEHPLQVVFRLQELPLAGLFRCVEVASRARHAVGALLKEGVGTESVTKVVVLPRFAGCCRAGSYCLTIDEDLDSAGVAGEVASVLVRLGQRVWADLRVVLR